MNKPRLLLCAAISMTVPYSYAVEKLMVEEIIVTARKKDEMQQDVPLTVNVYTDEMLDKSGISSLDKLADYTVGFDYSQAQGRQDFRPAIRGQSTILGGANAGLFIDGFYIGKGGPTLPHSAFQSVEVIKGPQSALFGRSTMAGAINYSLKRPSQTYENDIELTYGEDEEIKTDITSRGPINDQWGYLFSASYYSYGGQYTNRYAGDPLIGKPPSDSPIGGEETKSLIGLLEFDPTEDLEIISRLMYEKSEDDLFASAILPSSMNNCFRRVQDGAVWVPPANASSIFPPLPISTANPYKGAGYYCGKVNVQDALDAGSPSYEDDFFHNMGITFEALRFSLTTNWYIDDFTLTYNGSLHDYDGELKNDGTLGAVAGDTSDAGFQISPVPGPVVPSRFGLIREDIEDTNEMSHEFRLASPDERSLRFLTGLFFYQIEESSKRRSSGDVDADRNGFPDAILFGHNLPFNDLPDFERNNWAIFGQLEYDFTDDLSATFEVRYTEEKVEVSGLEVCIDPTNCDQISERTATGDFTETYKAVLPRASISWFADTDAMFYAVISQGNKPGDFNQDPGLADSQRAVDEEKAWNYEIGAKTAWFDNRITANLALFYTDWKDQQLTTTTTREDGSGTFSILDNIGESEIKGFELELNARVTSFWDNYLGYSYTDSEITDYSIDPAWSISRGRVVPLSGYTEPSLVGFPYDETTGAVLITGTPLPQVSRDQVIFSNTLHGDLTADIGWFFKADYLYNSPRYADVYELAHTGHRNIINLRAGISNPKFDVELWVNNLTDDDTSPSITRFIETSDFFKDPVGSAGPVKRAMAVTLPEQRAAGITVRYRFGQ